MASEIYDVLIVGGGPAGLSVATVLARQLHTAVLFDSKVYRNERAKHMHNVATWDHKDPADFRQSALQDALNHYQTNKYQAVEVKKIQKINDSLFELEDANGQSWKGRKVVLACGVTDDFPNIEGYADCWARGVFYCLFCHGYEEKGKQSAGVLAVEMCALPPHALQMARNARQLSESVTIYTNGNAELGEQLLGMLGEDGNGFSIEDRPLKKLVKTKNGAEVIVVLQDGTEKVEAFLGHVPRSHVNGPFVEQLGLETMPNGDIKTTPPFLQTSVRGVFAAGDCQTPFKAIPSAISSGAIVGPGVSTQIQAEKYGQACMF